jgi:hypothetical protein
MSRRSCEVWSLAVFGEWWLEFVALLGFTVIVLVNLQLAKMKCSTLLVDVLEDEITVPVISF